MHNNGENDTPLESPSLFAASGASPVNISGLSLEQHRWQNGNGSGARRGQGMLGAGVVAKRPPSTDFPRRGSPNSRLNKVTHDAGSRAPKPVAGSRQKRGHSSRQASYTKHEKQCQSGVGERWEGNEPFETGVYGQRNHPMHRDSSYDSMPSRSTTLATSEEKTTHVIPAGVRWPGLILQPDSSPISQEQLAAEVKGIYAGLVMVEAKCMNIDAAQAEDPTTNLSQEQWQALIALHRTLLYEHHDFLMATQHPSATPALKGLATKYGMPARMWKHGIHAFLEVLRHRRPESHEHMLAFIYLAYQMMALLYETVPGFTDTWIECLGDLARYRMAIEEEREPHAQWGSVAASWYTKAADRFPNVGRLPHHLGILERPSLRKFAQYGKALTCEIPFFNAKDSMRTLCEPIAENGLPQRANLQATEACLCQLFAQLFLESPQVKIRDTFNRATVFFAQPASLRWRESGVPLAVTITSALLSFGNPTSPLRQAYDVVARRETQRSRPAAAVSANPAVTTNTDVKSDTRLIETAIQTGLLTFHTALRYSSDAKSIQDVLPCLHVLLGFFHSLSLIATDVNAYTIGWLPGLLDSISWAQLAAFLNILVRFEPVTARIEQCARSRLWLQPDSEGRDVPARKALPEDFNIRGLVWAFSHFSPGWFDDDMDDARNIETVATTKHRAQRSLYWSLRIAFVSLCTSDSPQDLFLINHNPGNQSLVIRRGQ
jgi:hypothetical protein